MCRAGACRPDRLVRIGIAEAARPDLVEPPSARSCVLDRMPASSAGIDMSRSVRTETIVLLRDVADRHD